MYIFNEEFLDKVEKRYGNLLPSQKPNIYHVATSDSWKTLRNNLESWVSLIDDANRLNVVRRLQKPESFEQTYNELVMGDYLRSLGFQPEYDREFSVNEQRFTPDWYIPSLKLAIDVFTSMPPKSLESRMKKTGELHDRLCQIPKKYVLRFRTFNEEVYGSLTSSDIHAVVTRVEEWLNSKPVQNDSIEINAITFTVIGYTNKVEHVLVIYTETYAGRGISKVENNIAKKVRKYLPLRKSGIGIAVAVFSSFYTGLSEEDLEEILYGQNYQELTIDAQTNKVITSNVERLDNGLFSRETYSNHLAFAILMLHERGNKQSTRAIPFPNPILGNS